MSKTPPTTIRLSITAEVRQALNVAKKRYPAMSEPEILKLGLSQIATGYDELAAMKKERDEIRKTAVHALGADYLNDPAEDIYDDFKGKAVKFS